MNAAASVFVGLGSNLDNPASQIYLALSNLTRIRNTCFERCSSLFTGPAMGGAATQADYVNAVVMMTTTLSPFELLTALQDNETLQGRVHGERWGPRIIDLDLLLYGRLIIEEDNLTVPHVGISQRAFVLLPLFELAPNLIVPNSGAVSDLLKAVDCKDLVRLGSEGMD